MNRGGFLKSIATLIAAPSLLSNAKFEPLLPSKEADKELEVQNLHGNVIRIYTNEPCRVGEKIISDMGSMAVILRVVNIGERYIEARPIKKDSYHFKDMTIFYRLGQLYPLT